MGRGAIWSKAAPWMAVVGVTILAFGSATVARAQGISTENIRVAETDAGDLVADAVRAAGSAEIGFVPAAAFKPGASVPRPATGEQAAGLVEPASDGVVVLNLRGDQVLAALERAVSFAPQPSAGFLQVSGIKFTFDARKEAQKRVSSVSVGGRPLEAARTYKVATTKPLANGQQGYYQIWGRGNVASDTSKSLAQALADYARSQGGSLSPSTDGRIAQGGK